MASCALQGLVKGISEVNMDHSSTNVVVRLLLLARLSETKHALQDKEAFCCEHNHNLMELRTGKAPNSPSHAFLPYRSPILTFVPSNLQHARRSDYFKSRS
ncbi:hypothetical protein Peur_015053 [Populus x canadensis]